MGLLDKGVHLLKRASVIMINVNDFAVADENAKEGFFVVAVPRYELIVEIQIEYISKYKSRKPSNKS